MYLSCFFYRKIGAKEGKENEFFLYLQKNQDMKQFLFIFLCLAFICPFHSFSQIEKGRTFVGGEAWFYRESFSESDETFSQFTLLPKFAHAFNDKDVLGAAIGFEVQSNLYTFIISPLYRRYVSSEEQYGIFAEAMPSLLLDDFGAIISTNIRFGATYFLTPKLAFEGIVNLFNLTVDPVYSEFRTFVGINTNSLRLALLFRF